MDIAVQASGALTRLVSNAASALASATTHAEILEAKVMSDVAYDQAKRAGRLAKATKAHDDLIMASHRAQADALEIQAQAKRRLADEYDAAQERGEVQKHGRVDIPEGNIKAPTAADLGITSKDIHEARQIRDAEEADPGIVRRTLDAKLEAKEEPTKAALREAVTEAAMKALSGGGKKPSNKNPLYKKPTPADEAWTHLFGDCRAMLEWATKENVALALAGRKGRKDDQDRNVKVIRYWSETLIKIVGMLDA